MPEWFEKKNMFFFLSTLSDFKKKAKQLGMPLNLPVKPDPIKQNIFTAKIAKDQPYIFDICHMGQEMTNRGFGLEFAHKLSTKIWSVKNWNMDEHLIEILSEFKLAKKLKTMPIYQKANTQDIDKEINKEMEKEMKKEINH